MKFVYATALVLTSFVSSAQDTQAISTASNIDCANFSSMLATEATSTAPNMASAVSQLVLSCPQTADRIVEVAVTLSQATDHQQIMQAVADTNTMPTADILLAAIAGGGDPVTLSEPTAGGNLSIIPASAATAPPVIGGRNGGTGPGVGDAASNN